MNGESGGNPCANFCRAIWHSCIDCITPGNIDGSNPPDGPAPGPCPLPCPGIDCIGPIGGSWLAPCELGGIGDIGGYFIPFIPPRISLPSFVGPLIPLPPEAIEAFFGNPTPFLLPIPAAILPPIDFFAIPNPVPPEDCLGTIVEIAGALDVDPIEAGEALAGLMLTLVVPLSRTVSASD